MNNFIETEAASVELAIEKALEELGVTRDRADVEVLGNGGLFEKAKVRVTVKDTLAEELQQFFNNTMERMGLKCRAKVEEKDDTLYAEISGEDSSHAIGYRGEVLDALQYLAVTFINEHNGENKKLVVDCENYREKRKETLTALAKRLAQKAVRLRRKIALEPMNPFERRIVHSALADSEIAKTQSEGEDLNRHVVIIPVGVELKDNRPIKNGDSRGEHRGDRGRNGKRGYGHRDDRRERRPRAEEPEVEDGNVYSGFFTEDDFVKPTPQGGPPKFKSFGHKKRF